MSSEDFGYLFGLAMAISVCGMVIFWGVASSWHLSIWLLAPVGILAWAAHLYLSRMVDIIVRHLDSLIKK